MKPAVARILSTGLYTPEESISNEELVHAYNTFVERWNADHPDEPCEPSSSEFIEKASGIKARYTMNKEGLLDPDRLRPRIEARSNDELSLMAEIGVNAAREAMETAMLGPDDIDAVICAASNMQRQYPAMAVEIQNALGIGGYGFDMNVACASAAFGIQTAVGLLATGARRVLMVNPEICTAHINFKDRDGHFIFGDVATAVIIAAPECDAPEGAFDVLGTRLKTVFSNNIRNNFGFLNFAEDDLIDPDDPRTDKLFKQNGRLVFREVCPMVAEMIGNHLGDEDIDVSDVQRLWLHQANISMNRLIAKKLLGREPTLEEAPMVLDEYANTSSAGSIIAFHKHKDDLESGSVGVISGFGAGYSAGSIIVRAC
ncbi:MAG: beta-ketoacyl-ACP synthase III [Pseudomonadota bacterium]